MIELNDGTLSVKIKERGAELSSVVLGGREYIWQGDEKIWSGQCPVLFPICGKLRDGTYRYGGRTYSMELHGFAREKIFSVKQVSPQEAVFTICDDEQTRAQYPFSFVFSVTYTLQGGELKITYSVYNRGNEPMWFNFGSHESYRTEGQEGVWTLEWSEREDLVLRDLSPNGISDCHTLLRENTKEVCIEQSLFVQDSLVFDGLRSREVTLKCEGQPAVQIRFPGFDYLVLWKMPNAPYLSIEPWNGLPDRENTSGELSEKYGIRRLGGGELCAMTHFIRFFEFTPRSGK